MKKRENVTNSPASASGRPNSAKAARSGAGSSVKMAICLALALMLALSAAACGSGNSKTAASLTLTDGVLMVGMEVGYPPMEYLEEDGTTVTGFDYEVAGAIAAKLGLTVQVVDTAWDGIFSSLDSDRYDCIISSVSINPERQAAYNLTKPYVANKIVIVTRNGSGIASPEALAGMRVATQTETTSDEYMGRLQDEGLVLGEYYVYDKIIQCFDELILNRIDAVVVDSVVAAYYMGEDADKLSVVWENDEAEPLGICLKKGNDALTQAIEETVDGLYADGTMKTLALKYFGMDITEGVR